MHFATKFLTRFTIKAAISSSSSPPALTSLELPYCCPFYAKLAVAGAPGGPVHVFGREAKPGIALLCQARRLHQHPPQSTPHRILSAHAKPPFLCPPQKRPSQPPRQALQAAEAPPQRRLWIFNVGLASFSHPPLRLFLRDVPVPARRVLVTSPAICLPAPLHRSPSPPRFLALIPGHVGFGTRSSRTWPPFLSLCPHHPRRLRPRPCPPSELLSPAIPMSLTRLFEHLQS